MSSPEQPCGFLVLDKPAGLSSHACVARVRRAYGLKRVGHGGTLDPAVTLIMKSYAASWKKRCIFPFWGN